MVVGLVGPLSWCCVAKASEVLLSETTNSSGVSQLTWHDCVFQSQGNPFIPLPQALCPVDLQAVQVMLAFRCELCYWITQKPLLVNVLICSSSCSEPQGCCCERSEQQQTCYNYYVTVHPVWLWYIKAPPTMLANACFATCRTIYLKFTLGFSQLRIQVFTPNVRNLGFSSFSCLSK